MSFVPALPPATSFRQGYQTLLPSIERSMLQPTPGLLPRMFDIPEPSPQFPLSETLPPTLADPAESLERLRHIASTQNLDYQARFNAVINQLRQYLENYARKFDTSNAYLAMDLDETLLDNTSFELMRAVVPGEHFFTRDQKQQLQWLKNMGQPLENNPAAPTCLNDQWMHHAAAPAIPSTLSLVQWALQPKQSSNPFAAVGQSAQQNFKLAFITGREERYRADTMRNLQAIGLMPWQYELYMKPDFSDIKANDFKRSVQQMMIAQGKQIAAMLGDQDSDIQGAFGQGFKLPNPVYTIPFA